MDVKIEESWKELLKEEFEKPYFSELISFVKNEYATTRIYPPGKLIFNAFVRQTIPKLLFWARTHTTVRVRHTDFVFLYPKG